jgi:hypothetical protein
MTLRGFSLTQFIMLDFQLFKTDNDSHARRGTLTLNHGVVQTPIFMPVGMYGTVKDVMPRNLHETGVQIIFEQYHVHPGRGAAKPSGRDTSPGTNGQARFAYCAPARECPSLAHARCVQVPGQ